MTESALCWAAGCSQTYVALSELGSHTKPRGSFFGLKPGQVLPNPACMPLPPGVYTVEATAGGTWQGILPGHLAACGTSGDVSWCSHTPGPCSCLWGSPCPYGAAAPSAAAAGGLRGYSEHECKAQHAVAVPPCQGCITPELGACWQQPGGQVGRTATRRGGSCTHPASNPGPPAMLRAVTGYPACREQSGQAGPLPCHCKTRKSRLSFPQLVPTYGDGGRDWRGPSEGEGNALGSAARGVTAEQQQHVIAR